MSTEDCTSPQGGSSSADSLCLKAALALLKRGLWPVVISSVRDRWLKGNAGKAPIGEGWGLEPPTEASLRAAFAAKPDAGVGLLLGAKGGVIDIDVDDPVLAATTLARIFPEGEPQTLGWANGTDGRRHLLFQYDPALAPYGTVVKGRRKRDKATGAPVLDEKTGLPIVLGNPHFLGLEIRLGAKPDETTQFQTVVPPSPTLDGRVRVRDGNKEILPAPPSLLDYLARHAAPQPSPKANKPGPDAAGYTHTTNTNEAGCQRTDPFTMDGGGGGGASVEVRAIAYLAEIEPAEDGNGGSDLTLRAAAVLVVRYALPDEVGFRLLRDHYNPRCLPPWSDKELWHKIESAHLKPKHPYGDLLEPGDQGYGKGRYTGSNGAHADDGKQADPGGVFGSTADTATGRVEVTQEEYPEFQGEPRPVKTELLPVPVLPDILIPEAFRGRVIEVADRASAPPDFATAAMLTAGGSVIGRKAQVRPSPHDDFTTPPNLWGMAISPPGDMKSSAIDEGMSPVGRLQAEAAEAHKLAMVEFRKEKMVEAAMTGAAESKLKEAAKKPGATRESLLALAKQEEEVGAVEPVARRFMAGDATNAKLGELLRDNPNGLLVSLDELSSLLRRLSTAEGRVDRGLYLQGWNGIGSHLVGHLACP
jgi:hypothetical protein